jgi:hypothetical protein
MDDKNETCEYSGLRSLSNFLAEQEERESLELPEGDVNEDKKSNS